MVERKIDNNMMNRIENLSKLSLTEEERAKAMKEMDKILEYVSKLNEIDTDGVEPLVNVLPINNVLREDEVVEEGCTVCGAEVKEDCTCNLEQKKAYH